MERGLDVRAACVPLVVASYTICVLRSHQVLPLTQLVWQHPDPPLDPTASTPRDPFSPKLEFVTSLTPPLIEVSGGRVFSSV